MEACGDKVRVFEILRPVFLLSCYHTGWANESAVCETERIMMQSASNIFKEGFQGPLWMPKPWLPKSLTSISEVANICMSTEHILTYSFLSHWVVYFKVFYLKFYSIFWSYYFPSPNTSLFTQLRVALSSSTPPFLLLFPLYITKQRMKIKTNKQTKNQDETKTQQNRTKGGQKHSVCSMFVNYSWAWGLPWCEVGEPSNTPLRKSDFLFPKR